MTTDCIVIESIREYAVTVDVPETIVITVGEQGPPGPPGVGGATVSPDAGNIIKQRPNGLYAESAWASSDW